MAKRWSEAAPHLAAVIQVQPRRDEAIYWLAVSKKNLNQFSEAITLCERALEINPRNPIVWNELGLCRMTQNQPEPAAEAFTLALRSDPSSGFYQHNLGMALARMDRIYKARDAFREAIRLNLNYVGSYLELAGVLETLAARDEAISMLRAALVRHPGESQLRIALASALTYNGELEEAESIYRKTMEQDPVTGNSVGLWLQQEGRFPESIDCFMTSLKADPVQGVAYYGLVEAKAFDIEGRSIIDVASPIVDSPELDLKGKTYLCYALAKAHEKLRNDEQAMAYFDMANQSAFLLYNEGRPFDKQDLVDQNSRRIAQYDAREIKREHLGASQSDRPIFIVGMIRSGTTLLDQIIASHPLVNSAGEPVFWMREADRVRRLPSQNLTEGEREDIANRYLQALDGAAGTSLRTSDKMPLNYSHVGLIHATFPKAKIVHLRRSPLDTCLSIYTTFLGHGPNFAYNQDHIVFNYLQYLRVMAHWRSVMPQGSFLEVNYEDLVSDRETVARRVIAFCELEWNDACLHHETNESSIRTPSKWQARQPVYKSSVERWKRFEPWLGELLELRGVVHPDPRH